MSCTQAHMYKKITKNFKIPNEQPAFRCQPDFGSHSQSLTNKLFSSVSSCALHEPLVHMMVKVLFSSFLNVFDHAYECASMHALVEIHKKQLRSKSGSFYFLIHFNHSNPDQSSTVGIRNPIVFFKCNGLYSSIYINNSQSL